MRIGEIKSTAVQVSEHFVSKFGDFLETRSSSKYVVDV